VTMPMTSTAAPINAIKIKYLKSFMNGPPRFPERRATK